MFGWETETFDAGGGGITLWRLPGYVGGEPEQPVAHDVVGAMSPMISDSFPDDVASHWGVNFWVDDADAIAGKATQLGGKVIVPPHDTPGFREAVLADPRGAVLSVSQLAQRTNDE